MQRPVKGFIVAIIAIAATSWLHGACRARGEIVIAERASPFNHVFVIEDANGLRRLRFDRHGVDQSAIRPGDPDHLEFAYVRQLAHALAWRPEPKRMLFIGLGGGTFPMFVRRHLPNVHIDVVELDPVVAEFAQEYMGFTTDTHLKLHLGDGRRFVLDSKEHWDIIVLDAYGSDNIPYALTTRPFLEGVRARLAPRGLVVANLWGEAVNDLFTDMLTTYDHLFAEVHVMAPKGSDSRVVLAFPETEGLRSDLLETAGRRLRKSWGLRFDLPTLARESYLPRVRWPRGGKVLEDRP